MGLVYSARSFTLFFSRMGWDDIFLAIKKENSGFFHCSQVFCEDFTLWASTQLNTNTGLKDELVPQLKRDCVLLH